MPWSEAALPVRMARVALVAPAGMLRTMLVKVAQAGCVELDGDSGEHSPQALNADSAPAVSGRSAASHVAAVLSVHEPDLAALAAERRADLIAGETQLRQHAADAVLRNSAYGLVGWMPNDQVGELSQALAGLGCAVVPLRRPRGVDAPTLMRGSAGRRAVNPLVTTYGTVPYADISPAWLAWGSYVVMFGMMFGDVGDGLLLIAAAIAMRLGWPRWLSAYRRGWPFVAGAGMAATAFGFAYGEFFGPTGVIGVLWLDPIARPIPLLVAAIAFGAVLLAGAYALGVVNRLREGGWSLALYAPSGIAGSALFVAVALFGGGWYLRSGALIVVGIVGLAAALVLALTGFLAEAGGGGYGLTEALVEVFDLVIRLCSNIASFARLAAFGLAHAALGWLVWEGAKALWHRGGVMVPLAVVVFVAGRALAFALEGLVAAVQALRLEYYELFSRIFLTQGRPFRPWHVPVDAGPVGLGSDGLGGENERLAIAGADAPAGMREA
jgi:V/A-type H+/Na+-transporting ATPase subunit I